MTSEEQKQEAIRRLELIANTGAKFIDNDYLLIAKKDFERGVIPVFEYQGSFFDSIYYWFDGWAFEDNIKQQIQEFEEEYNALVYMIIKHGSLYIMFYVSQYDKEWDADKNSLKTCYDKENNLFLTYCNVYNEAYGDGEIESICYKFGNAGGVVLAS